MIPWLEIIYTEDIDIAMRISYFSIRLWTRTIQPWIDKRYYWWRRLKYKSKRILKSGMIFLIQQINRMRMENDTVLMNKDKYLIFGKQKINEFISSTSRTRFEPSTYGYLHILHSKVLPPELPFRVMNCFDTIIQSISN